MRTPRAAIVALTTAIILTFACGFLATGASCPPSVGYPTGEASSFDQLMHVEPGASFELLLMPADLNTFAAAYLAAHEHAMIDTVMIGFGADTISIDLCARRILFRPVSVHLLLGVEQEQGAFTLSCPEWSIGRIRMPQMARTGLARRLDAEWALLSQSWTIEQWTLMSDSLYLAGVRRH